jgi:hypothetical protein
VEFRRAGSKIDNWMPGLRKPEWDFNQVEYRRKPQTKLIPWTVEDITPEIAGAWFNYKDSISKTTGTKTVWFNVNEIAFIQGCETRGTFEIPLIKRYTFIDLINIGVKYSTDLKTWKPCGKVVNE